MSILNIPKNERNLIVILDNAEAETRKKEKYNIIKDVNLAATGLFGRVAPVVIGGAMLVPVVSSVLAGYAGYRLLKNISNEGKSNFNYLSISLTEARNLSFPPGGHPQIKGLYVRHPFSDVKYYPIEEYHRNLFMDKLSELVNLCRSLGAVYIKVEYKSGMRNGGHIKGKADKIVEGELGAHKSCNTDVFMEYQYENNTSCKLPSDMRWYDFESEWKQVAAGRLENNLKKANIRLNYNEDFGITSKLMVEVEKAGFGANVKYEQFQATEYQLEVIF